MANKTPIAAIFESMKGSWRMRRALDSSFPGFPSGVFEGTATFKPRQPTAHSVASELLYHETGELRTDNGLTFKANRKYVYRYSADEDKISAWFVKEESKQDDGREEVDYLFHDLEMSQEGGNWVGRGEHLCSLDMYWAYYEFRHSSERDEEMNLFGIRYKVEGPKKKYKSDAAYERCDTPDASLPTVE